MTEGFSEKDRLRHEAIASGMYEHTFGGGFKAGWDASQAVFTDDELIIAATTFGGIISPKWEDADRWEQRQVLASMQQAFRAISKHRTEGGKGEAEKV